MFQLVRIQGVVAAVIREDGAQIPPDDGNADWRAFLAWNAAQAEPFSLATTAPSLNEQRAAKLAALEAWWEQQKAAGVIPPGYTFALGIDWGDVALLNGALSMAEKALANDADDSFPIVDRAGVVRFFTVAAMNELLLSYAGARTALSIEYAGKRAAIETVETLEGLQAIQVAGA